MTTGLDGSPHEPLAADARKWADGKLLAKLKIVSGICGIRLDDLRQRNMQRLDPIVGLEVINQLAWRLEKRREADKALSEAMDSLSSLVSEKPEHRYNLHQLANTWFEYWIRHGVLPSDQAVTVLDGYLVDPKQATSCADASLAARLEVMRGNISLAKDYTSYLLDKGFYEPGFVAFCRRYDLCDK